MQYLFYFLALMPFTIFAQIPQPHIPQGVLEFSCRNQQGKIVKIPIADTKASLTSACNINRSNEKKFTEFPKRYSPFYNQQLSATSNSGKYYINPINKIKYPNAVIVTTDDCGLAGVMMAKSGVLSGSQTGVPPVAARPENSVRTRPALAAAPYSVRTRPIAARWESNTEETENLEKRAKKGSEFLPCTSTTYNWDADTSGYGRPVNRIPVPGSRTPF